MSVADIALNIGFILVFIIIGGVFSAAEMAMVSLRETQVRQLAHRGKRGAAVARLTSNPNLFLSSVQVGVTIAGFLGASFGEKSLSPVLARVLQRGGLPGSVAETVATLLITLGVAYFSIVLGELTAKRLAMQRAQGFALALAPLVSGIATVLRPVIWLLDVSTNVVVRVLGGDPHAKGDQVTNEELRALVSSSETLGVEERQIVGDVFAAGERTLREVMVPRTEVDFLGGDMPAYKAIRAVQGAPHSRYPVMNGSPDDVAGFLHVRDLMDLDNVARQAPVAQLARPVLFLPETVHVLHALTAMRRESAHLAIVRDEYGGTSGIVTLEDLVEELVGDITDEYDEEEGPASLSDVDGLATLEDFEEMSGHVIPEGPYDTIAGFIMAQLGALPQVGDRVEVTLVNRDGEDPQAFEMIVTEMDGRRASRVAVNRI